MADCSFLWWWQEVQTGTSLVDQWLRIYLPLCGNMGLSPSWGTKIPPATGQLRPCPTTREAHVLQQKPSVAKNNNKKRNSNYTSPDMWARTFTPALPSNYHKSQTSLLSLLSKISFWRLPSSPESLIMWVINLIRPSWGVCGVWTKFGVTELIPSLQGDTGSLDNDHHSGSAFTHADLLTSSTACWRGCFMNRSWPACPWAVLLPAG